MALQVSPEEMLQEAYRALGEQIVHNRLISRHAIDLQARIDAATPPADEPTNPGPVPDADLGSERPDRRDDRLTNTR